MKDSRFLAVDDDPVFRLILEEALQRIGWTSLATAGSAREALEIISNGSERFDCFFLDIEMPEMDGIELCARIRALQGHQRTPIIMITSVTNREHVERAFRAGATDYMTKPIDHLELKSRVMGAARLISERRKSDIFEKTCLTWSDVPGLNPAFEEPIPLSATERLIEYLALQNHLLTLGRLELWDHVAIAFRVVNAHGVYKRLDRLAFMDYMADLVPIINDAMKRYPCLTAYAGSGEFVCLTRRTAGLSSDEIALSIEESLRSLEQIHSALDVPPPIIHVGRPQGTGLFASHGATKLLERALRSVREIGGLRSAQSLGLQA